MITAPPSATATLSPVPTTHSMGLTVAQVANGPQLEMVVAGEADICTSEHLRTELLSGLRSPPAAVVVDVSALTFCDLSGLDALHAVSLFAIRAGIPLTFRGMSTVLTWLDCTFPHPSLPPSGLAPSLLPRAAT